MSSKLLLAACGASFIFAAGVWFSFLPKWHRPLMKLSIITMFFDIVSASVGGITARPYQAITIALLIAMGFRSLAANAPAYARSLVSLSLIFTLLCWVSLSASIDRSDTLQVALGQTYLMALVVGIILGVRTGVISVSDVTDSLIIGATISSAAAIVEFVASYGGLNFQTGEVTGIPWHRAAGLMTEPDWGGLVAAIGLLASYFRGSSRGPERSWSRWKYVPAVNGAALLIAGARAAWISFVATVIILGLTNREVRRRVRRLLPVILAVVLLGAAYGATHPSALSRLSPNAVFGGSGAGDDGSTHSRIGVLDLIEASLSKSLWLGHGSGTLAAAVSYPLNQAVYGGGGQLNAGHGNANLEFTFLWDGGLVMLCAFVLFAVVWLGRAWRSRGQPELLAMTLVMLFDFQFNNGIRFAFVWVVVAASSVSTKNGHMRSSTATTISRLGELPKVALGGGEHQRRAALPNRELPESPNVDRRLVVQAPASPDSPVVA